MIKAILKSRKEIKMKQGKSILKAGIGYTLGNYLLKGIAFLTIPIFSYLLTTEEYGLYNIFVAYEGILCIVLSLAINSSYKNARYKYKTIEEGVAAGNDYNTYISNTMVLLIASLGTWLLIGNMLVKVAYSGLGLDRLTINCLVIYSFSTAVITCFNADVSLRYDYKSFLKVAAMNAIGNICLSVVLIMFVFENRYIGRVIGTTIPIFLIAIVIVIKYVKKAYPSHTIKMLRWGIKYSVPIMPHGIGQVVLSQFDRIMINRIINAASAGIYSFAYNIYVIVNITAVSLDNIWSPWFYEQMNGNRKTEIMKKSKVYMIMMFLFSLFIVLISPELIWLLELGAGKYHESVYCVIPIVTGGFFSFMSFFPIGAEYYTEKTKYIAYATIGAAGLNIFLNQIFISRFGYIAAAYTTLFTYIVNFVFHYNLVKKKMKMSLFSDKTVIIVSVLIMLFSGLALLLIHTRLVRWGGALLVGMAFLYYAKKEIANK